VGAKPGKRDQSLLRWVTTRQKLSELCEMANNKRSEISVTERQLRKFSLARNQCWLARNMADTCPAMFLPQTLAARSFTSVTASRSQPVLQSCKDSARPVKPTVCPSLLAYETTPRLAQNHPTHAGTPTYEQSSKQVSGCLDRSPKSPSVNACLITRQGHQIQSSKIRSPHATLPPVGRSIFYRNSSQQEETVPQGAFPRNYLQRPSEEKSPKLHSDWPDPAEGTSRWFFPRTREFLHFLTDKSTAR